MLFTDLSLIEPLLRALETEGYERPTPIQEQAIPPVLQRRDLLGCAQTGTGKTAAFALPILQILYAEQVVGGDANNGRVGEDANNSRNASNGRRDANNGHNNSRRPIRSLILTPTRELAIQIAESFTAYGRNTGVRNLVVFGGVGQTPQTDALRRGTDILVATPGRLLDLMNQGFISLRDVGIFVLDEADRMLDMGFIHDVKKIIAKLPTQRQTLFFSATMPPEIAKLSDSILTDPVKVAVTPVASTAENVAQKVFFVDRKDKKLLLVHVLKDQSVKSALVFTRTKHGANKVTGDLVKAGIRAEAIHGNKSQNARQAALSDFKKGKIRVLVATDIAARGIDIEELSHVVNFELPNIPETYVHRIGRTGRAGASGIALSFCEAEEIPYLKDIQKLTGQLVPVEEEHPFAADLTAPGLPQPMQRGDRPAPIKSGGGNNGRRQPAQMVKTPAPLRPGTIPLPDRKPDTRRQEQANRPARPLREHASNVVGGDANNGRSDTNDRHTNNDRYASNDRRENNDRRDNNRRNEQRQQSSQRPQQQRNERPARFRDERDNGRSQQRSQQNTAAKPNSSEAPATTRNRRFASILEVATIEKQDRPQKPKPNYRDRDDRSRDNRSGDNRPPFNGDRKKKRW